jgi:hypothetical protein
MFMDDVNKKIVYKYWILVIEFFKYNLWLNFLFM